MTLSDCGSAEDVEENVCPEARVATMMHSPSWFDGECCEYCCEYCNAPSIGVMQ